MEQAGSKGPRPDRLWGRTGVTGLHAMPALCTYWAVPALCT